MRKILKSAILAVLALFVILSIFPTSVFAKDNSFEPRLTAPNKGNSYYNRTLNVYAQGGYGLPNCTAYAYGRIYEITGEAPLIKRGSADEWWSINKRNGYYEYGQEPRIGAIACWSNHVSVVEKIEGNMVTASQSHWHGNYFDTSTFKSGTDRYGQKFYGYIYASDSYFEKLKKAEEEKEEQQRIEAEKLAKASTTYKIEKVEYKTFDLNTEHKVTFEDINPNQENNILMKSRMLANALAWLTYINM